MTTRSEPVPSIALVCVFFGRLPLWMPAFLLSCRTNPSVTWHIYTDGAAPISCPPNVRFIPITLDGFNRRASDATDQPVRVTPSYSYKICDLKPAYGSIFKDDLRGFNFWGCCDLDIVWGDIRAFMKPDLLAAHDILTTRVKRVSGHFCLFRNTPECREFYRSITGAVAALANPVYSKLDEKLMTDYIRSLDGGYLQKIRAAVSRRRRFRPEVYWNKVLTTYGADQRPMYSDAEKVLKWKRGKAFNAEGKEMMYLHFDKIKHTLRTIDFSYEAPPEEFTITTEGMFGNRTPLDPAIHQ